MGKITVRIFFSYRSIFSAPFNRQKLKVSPVLEPISPYKNRERAFDDAKRFSPLKIYTTSVSHIKIHAEDRRSAPAARR